ncbi:hypothetical protein F5Y19DRAFT_281697 [Xylariaceae sp. FL1651]|nr:hypothetical protein F5Y19DRAFT_281697 [Xylariaceae sp. FL1651]
MTHTTYQSPYKPTPTSTQFDTFLRWARLKKYRIEVTYGVYVYTPMEKVVFWTLFCFLFVTISTAALLFTHRNLTLLARAAASHIDRRALSDRLATQLLAAKRAVTGLTTPAQLRGVENTIGMMSGAAKNSQVA